MRLSIAGRFCRDGVLSRQMKQRCDAVRELSRLQALQNTKLDAAMTAASR
jgi:hypothetical protein